MQAFAVVIGHSYLSIVLYESPCVELRNVAFCEGLLRPNLKYSRTYNKWGAI